MREFENLAPEEIASILGWEENWRENPKMKAEMFRLTHAGKGVSKCHASFADNGTLKEGYHQHRRVRLRRKSWAC